MSMGHNNSGGSTEPVRPLTAGEFEQFRRLAHEKFGLDLRKGKEQLVSARLSKQMREWNIRSFQDYYKRVVEDDSGEAMVAMIDALTTNYTSFFREPAHFEFLKQTVLPSLAGRDRIRIWTAACATGEEPYSILICLLEALGPTALGRIGIVATDISTRALATAARAMYDAEKLENVPSATVRKYLLRGVDKAQGLLLVRKELRAAVEFRRLNLIEPLPALGNFPVIFCRNVMIYFDKPTQQEVVRKLAGCLESGGYLFIGHAESLTGVDHALEYVRPAVYRKPETGRERRGR